MPSDPYTDDEYDDSYERVHGDEPARDQYTDRGTDDTFFPSGSGRWSAFSPSGWGLWPSRDTVDADYDRYDGDEEYATRDDAATEDSGDDSWWEEGLAGTLIVAGFVLFVIPEPATSALGILLMGAGVVLWLVDWMT